MDQVQPTFEKKIKVVYYAYIHRWSNWIKIISGQLSQLKDYGLLDVADLYIHITDPSELFDDVIALIETVSKTAKISTSAENQFEYPGIKLVYDLARENLDAIFIYLHTKGMSHEITSRLTLEVALLKGTFESWRENIKAFEDKQIKKIGLFPAKEDPVVQKDFKTKGGWMWYNFWYARGSYLANYCQEPLITNNRWYYEVWVAGPYNEAFIPVHDCYSLYYNKPQIYFNVDEVQLCLPKLIDKLSHDVG